MHDEQNIRPITAARIPVADLEIGCDIETTKAITIITKNKKPDRTIPDGTADGCSRLWMLGRGPWIIVVVTYCMSVEMMCITRFGQFGWLTTLSSVARRLLACCSTNPAWRLARKGVNGETA